MPEDGHSIGFNDLVQAGGVDYQVQTEVVGQPEAKILTTVMAGGGVRHSERHAYPDGADRELARAVIKAQHDSVIERVTSGDIQ